ncbi:MAG: bifunctional metallophosphatase/5'-nucleotidase [Candidatus Omnitrophica bacterium]|nr:bifunctional metallophosphatase/5'-nucleotidase [Candidatus Omnitrophota bacterium]
MKRIACFVSRMFNVALCSVILFIGCNMLSAAPAFAKDITFLFTGETHAMLYPCSCPIERDGGIARRATLLKQLKKKYPGALVLDSGGFFAGGVLDEYAQNTELDTQRTLVNLRAMELMGYDAVAIGDEELNFGADFLKDNINKTKLNFISANCRIDKSLPYIIKETDGVKVGITALTTLSAMEKAKGVKFIDPKQALMQVIPEMRKNGADIILVLSHLGESEDLNLLNEVKGINVLITGHSIGKGDVSSKAGDTLILRPSWQGRKIGRATLDIKNNKIVNYKVEGLRLSDKIADDQTILSILPRCFSDAGCKKEGLVGVCQEAGTLNAKCVFSEADKIELQVITLRSCKVCDTSAVVNFLKMQFPGISISYLYYPEKKAEELVKKLNITGLPAYLLGKEIAKESLFAGLKANLDDKGNVFMLKPSFVGLSYFISREKIKGKLDIFFSLNDKTTPELLAVIKDFKPQVHFLAAQEDGKFSARGGNLEVEEYLRCACVEKYYPDNYWDYLSCRAKNINSSWWQDCLGNMDEQKIKTCARGEEGQALLGENIKLNKELKVMIGPAYLVDNQEIFGTKGVPSKEELKKLFKR